MLRVKGDPSNLDRMLEKAHGLSDCAPVDFTAWAASQGIRIAAGTDPLEIERELARAMCENGMHDPAVAMSVTFGHRQMRQDVEAARKGMRRCGLSTTKGADGHGLALPGFVIDPKLTSAQRREAFLRMAEDCRIEDQDLETAPDSSSRQPPVETAFSIASLLPLEPSELVPTWAGREWPMRDRIRWKTWGSAGGGLTCERVERPSPDMAIVIGIKHCEYGYPLKIAALHLTRNHEVAIEVTSWGGVQRYAEGAMTFCKQSGYEFAMAAAAAPIGIRSGGELTQILRHGRHDQAARCFDAIRERTLHPSLGERTLSGAMAATVAALRLKDSLDSGVQRVQRKTRRELSQQNEDADDSEQDRAPRM